MAGVVFDLNGSLGKRRNGGDLEGGLPGGLDWGWGGGAVMILRWTILVNSCRGDHVADANEHQRRGVQAVVGIRDYGGRSDEWLR